MNFTAPSALIAAAAARAKRIAKRDVLLTPGKQLVVTADSYTMLLRQTLPFEATGQPVLVPAADFAQQTKAVSGELTVKPHPSKSRLQLAAGKRRAELATLDPSNEPGFVVPEPKDGLLSADAPTLRALLDRVRGAAAPDGEERQHLRGVLLEAHGKALRAVATNGHWLGVVGDLSIEPSVSVLLPMPLVTLLLDLLPADGSVSIAFNLSSVRVDGDGWTATHTAIGAAYPAWRHVVPEHREISAHVDRDELLAEVGAVSATGGDAIVVLFHPGGIGLTAEDEGGARLGESDVVARVQPDDAHERLGLSAQYVRDALRAMPPGEVVLSTTGGPLYPVVVEPSDGSAVAIVMPRRI